MPNLQQQLKLVIDAQNNTQQALSGVRNENDKTFGSKPGGMVNLANVGKAAVAGLAVGFGALAAAAIKSSITTAANFQQSMAKIRAVTGATDEQFKALGDAAKEMGATTQFSASQAAGGIELLGMAGLSTDSILTALPQTLNLAAAGAISLSEAADISTNIVSGMGLKVEDLSHIVDGLSQAARSSNTDVSGLGQAYSFAAASAASAGLGFTLDDAKLACLEGEDNA